RPAGDAVRVLTLGKAAAWKGMADVVEAVSRFARDNSRPVVLWTYGPDPVRRSPAHAAYEHHGFVGPQRLAELYRSSDVCVSASWYESFPLPPLEAMACATPVICTRLGTEDYADHERNCLLVPPKDPDAVAAALRRIAADGELRASLVKEGIETASRFTW